MKLPSPKLSTMVATLMFCSVTVSAATAESGSMLFEDNCASCHMGDERGTDRVAPPAFAMKQHYLVEHPDRDAFVKAVVDWLKAPSQEKSLMPGAIRKFDLMPALELEDSEVKAIAEFVYDGQFNTPGWYRKHYLEEHGKLPELGQ